MTTPCVLSILPFEVWEHNDFVPFHVSVAWQEAIWCRCLPKQMGQAASLSWRFGPDPDARKLGFLAASGDRERRRRLLERLAGDLDRDVLDLYGLASRPLEPCPREFLLNSSCLMLFCRAYSEASH